jgi:TIR domain-containing protein
MPLLILPLPSRFDGRAEVSEAQEWLNKIEVRLANLYDDWLPKGISIRRVLELTKIPYVPLFSYGEKLPVLTHGTSDPDGPGYYYDRVARLIEREFGNVESVFPVDDTPAGRTIARADANEGVRRRVGNAASVWRENGGQPEWLLRGEFLDEAWGLVHSGALEFGESEKEFLVASMDWREREAERRRYVGRRGFLGEPFRYDLFVSYSHGEFDGSGQSNLKRWSQAFVSELEKELRQHPKFRDLSIFVDRDYRPSQSVDPTEPLSRQLREEIGASGILVVLMSPHYLVSKWCVDERDWWVQWQERYELPIEGRIVVARIWPTDSPWTDDPWPPALTDERGHPLVGFTFYDRKNAASHPWPFNWPDPTDAKGPFRDVLLHMAGLIWQRLAAIKEELEEAARRRTEAERLSAGGGHVIYLHAREVNAEAWERAGDALAKSGFIVLPSEPDRVERDPAKALEIAERRVATLSGCDGLLLLGADDGWALDADLVVVGRRDRQLARERSERLLPCAVLNTAGPVIGTQRRMATARALHIGWIDATQSTWLTDVRGWLTETGAAMERV